MSFKTASYKRSENKKLIEEVSLFVSLQKLMSYPRAQASFASSVCQWTFFHSLTCLFPCCIILHRH